VEGLTAPDFELKDNGVRQQIRLVAADALPLLSVLAFDQSVSLGRRKLAALRAAGRSFLASLEPDDEAALLAFSQEVEWLARPTRDRGAVLGALEGLYARGNTALMDALYAAILLPDSRARKLVVLFSDGEDNASWLGEGEVRAVAERSNALIHVVTVRYRPGGRQAAFERDHLEALTAIAEVTGGRTWEAESPERLTAAFAEVAEAMRRRYVLRYEPEGVRRHGWHRIELRVRGRSADVQARRGYWIADP
jgi:Ca-activated chloride channel family protein